MEDISDKSFLNLNNKNYNFDSLLVNTKLKSLAINDYNIDDSILKKINQLVNLETITFNSCMIKSESTKLINTFKEIILSYTNLDLNIFNSTESLIEIEILNDKDDNVTIDIKDLLRFKNLEVLRIYNSKVKNSIDINKFCKLKKLFLDGSFVDVKNFANILNKQLNFTYRKEYLFD